MYSNKLNAIAAGVALAVTGGVAHAGLPGVEVEIIVGGASAPQNFFREDTVQRICDSSQAIDVFVDEIQTLPGGGDMTDGSSIMAQDDQSVVKCTADASMPADLAGRVIAVYKFNGGSATGVAPVDDPDGAPDERKRYMDADEDDVADPTVAGCRLVDGGAGDVAALIANNDGDPGNDLNISVVSVDGTWVTNGVKFNLWECGTDQQVVQAPDAGISDVEPGLFVGELASNFGIEPAGVDAAPAQPFANNWEGLGGGRQLVVQGGAALVFGVQVTKNLRDELQNDQIAAGQLPDCEADVGDPADLRRETIECMPSMPRAFVVSAYSGDFSTWSSLNVNGLSIDGAPDNDRVNLCRRRSGSGTHAQFMVEYHGTNCIDGSPIMVDSQPNGSIFGGGIAVYTNSGSSDQSDCLEALATGNGFDGDFDDISDPSNPIGDGDSDIVPAGRVAYGMAYNSLEKNTGNGADLRPNRFVKIDGVAPTLENAFNGDYEDVYQLSYQHRAFGDGDPDLRLGGIRTDAPTQAEIDAVEAYFTVWTATTPAAVAAVNSGLIVDPDGIDGNGDEWQGGFLVPANAAATTAFNTASPITPWSRERAGTADSCQRLRLKP